MTARSKYVGCSLSSCPGLWANASPYNHLDSTASPLFIANSLNDQIPYQEALDFYALAGRLGVPAVLCTAPGGHARGYEDKTCAEDQSQTVFERTLSWLHTQLG